MNSINTCSLEDDQLQAMLTQENETYHCPDYLNIGDKNQPIFTNDDQVSFFPDAEKGELWRRKICEWSYKVVDHFRLDREVVSISLSYLDRYLAIQGREYTNRTDMEDMHMDEQKYAENGQIDSTLFQLFAITSLYIAVKIHAENIDGLVLTRMQRLSIHSFVELTRGQFTVEDLLTTERHILCSLNWRVNPPTPMKFIYLFLRFLPTSLSISTGKEDKQIDERVVHVLYELSRYLTELSVCVYSLSVTQRQPAIAFASILISISLIDPEVLPYKFRDFFLNRMAQSTYLQPDDIEIVEIVSQMQDICPDFSACACQDCKHDWGDHPLSIARDAGFLVSSSTTKKSKRNDILAHSPKCISQHGQSI